MPTNLFTGEIIAEPKGVNLLPELTGVYKDIEDEDMPNAEQTLSPMISIRKGVETYLEYGQAAFKWAVSGMPEEDAERYLDMEWADVIRETYPMFKNPKSRLARSVMAQFGVEMAGSLLDMGTRPSTYLAWGLMERFVPPILRAGFKKLPKGIQQELIKERFLWGRHPIDLAYKELGLKPTASFRDVTNAFRKRVLKWHPDKAPVGQSIKYTRNFLRTQGAYDKIKSSTVIAREAEVMVGRGQIPAKAVVKVEPTIPVIKPKIVPKVEVPPVKPPITPPIKPIEPLVEIIEPKIVPTISLEAPPPKKPPKDIKGLEGPEGEGEDVAIEYERQKDVWIGKKDVRVLQSKIEQKNLQKELLKTLKKTKYDAEAKEFDKAIQIHIDTKRNPEHITEFYNKLTSEQQKLIDISQDLPSNVKPLVDKITKSYEALGLEALESDVIKNVLDNYAGRIWDIPKGQSAPFRKFGTTTRHAKKRVFETIIQGWSEGYKLKVEGSINNLQILKEEIVKTIEDKKFIKSLQKLKTIEGEPLLSTRQLEDYIRIEHPNFKVWRYAGEATEAKTYGRNFFVDSEGVLFERKELYAPKKQAKNLNNILGISKLKGIPAIDVITKYNAIIKAWILQTSFFHHLAFTRSYYFGTNDKKWTDMSLRQAYQQGLRMIDEESPMIMLGVKNGLTLGLKQDWNEELLREETAIGKLLDKWKTTKVVKDKIMNLRQTQADFLFGEFGAGLKAKAFVIEYKNLIKKHPDKSIDELAKMAANLINDDFGGLHLQRLGRNPTLQHIFRLFALAPDWTESNVRTMVKAVKSGTKAETNFYRRFWAGVLTKGVGLTVLGNLIMALFDEDDREAQGAWERFIRNYQRAWEEGHFRFLDVDITPLYRSLGGTDEETRKYFSVLGHFKDPIKFIVHPVRSAHHKGSVVYRFFMELLTGTDWAGRRFTTAGELAEKKKTVIWSFEKKGPIEFNQIPSFLLNQVKGWQPIQIQNLIGWVMGEMIGFVAFGKSMGLRISTTYPRKKKKSKKIKF